MVVEEPKQYARYLVLLVSFESDILKAELCENTIDIPCRKCYGFI